jgi:hypothetical protein
MKEPRNRKKSLADAAKEAVPMFACDPYGWLCVLLVFGKSRQAGFAIVAAYACVVIIAVLILWQGSQDT